MMLYDCLIKTKHFAIRYKSMYRVWSLPDPGWLTDFLIKKVLKETPVNGGLTYEGPKVAKSLGC